MRISHKLSNINGKNEIGFNEKWFTIRRCKNHWWNKNVGPTNNQTNNFSKVECIVLVITIRDFDRGQKTVYDFFLFCQKHEHAAKWILDSPFSYDRNNKC